MDPLSHKVCKKCGEDKPLSEFPKGRNHCKKCRAEALRLLRRANPEAHREEAKRYYTANKDEVYARIQAWQQANPDKKHEYNRRYVERLRETVFRHYGTSCACCGATEQLSIDHVNGDGRQHRMELGGNTVSAAIYRWLVDNDFPEGFQTLCMPCNSSKDVTPACRKDHSKGSR